MLDAFRNADPRIRVIDHPANLGLSAARNTGFRAARAELVVQLDSDDLIEPTAIEKWSWFLESYPEYSLYERLYGPVWPGSVSLAKRISQRDRVSTEEPRESDCRDPQERFTKRRADTTKRTAAG